MVDYRRGGLALYPFGTCEYRNRSRTEWPLWKLGFLHRPVPRESPGEGPLDSGGAWFTQLRLGYSLRVVIAVVDTKT